MANEFEYRYNILGGATYAVRGVTKHEVEQAHKTHPDSFLSMYTRNTHGHAVWLRDSYRVRAPFAAVKDGQFLEFFAHQISRGFRFVWRYNNGPEINIDERSAK